MSLTPTPVQPEISSISEPPAARRRLAIGATAAFGAQIATVMGSAITSVIIARMFGPSGTGKYALVINLFAAVALLTAFGLPTGITFTVSRGQWSPRSAFRQSQLLALVAGSLGAALGLLFYNFTRHTVMKGISWGEAVAGLAVVPAFLAWTFAGSVAIARDHYEKFAKFQFTRSLATLALVVAVAVPFGVPGAIIGFAAAQVLSAVLAGFSMARLTRRRDSDPGDTAAAASRFEPLRRTWRFSIKAWSADVLQFLNYRLDLFLVGAFATRADVGRYSVAVSLTMLGWLLPQALAQVLLPRAASLDAAAGGGRLSAEESDRAVTRVIRHTVILQVPTGVVLAALLLIGVPVLYGRGFHQAILLGFLLVPGVLVLSVGKVISAVVTGRNKPIYSLYTGLVTVPITVALYWLLIPAMGAVGAAIASSISYILSTAIGAFYLRRVIARPLREALFPTAAELLEFRGVIGQLRLRATRRVARTRSRA